MLWSLRYNYRCILNIVRRFNNRINLSHNEHSHIQLGYRCLYGYVNSKESVIEDIVNNTRGRLRVI